MDVSNFTALVVNSYEGNSFVQSDENYTWKATKKGEHAQSDYNTGTGTGTVSTGLTGVTNVVGQACYYSDIESGSTGSGEIATIGLPPFTINAHSAFGSLKLDINIYGIPTADTDTLLDLHYFTTRDGVQFNVDTMYGGRQPYGSNANYSNTGGAIKTNGTWYDTDGQHDMVSLHGCFPAVAFRPYDFTMVFRQTGLYAVSTFFTISDPPTAAFASDCELKYVNASTSEVLAGAQLPTTLLGNSFMCIFYISDPGTVVKTLLKFITMSTSGDFAMNVVVQKLQTKDSNPIDTVV